MAFDISSQHRHLISTSASYLNIFTSYLNRCKKAEVYLGCILLIWDLYWYKLCHIQLTAMKKMVPWPSWLRRGANNAKISSSILLGTIHYYWACGVVGSAFALQAKGHRFDSGLVHNFLILFFYKRHNKREEVFSECYFLISNITTIIHLW